MDRDGFEQDPKNLQVFRLIHLGKIAHFPGGKSASSTQQIVNAAFSLFELFLDKMQELCGGVCVFDRFVLDGKDWLALKKQTPTYSYNTRKSQQGQGTPLKPVVKLGIGSSVETPPFAKKMGDAMRKGFENIQSALLQSGKSETKKYSKTVSDLKTQVATLKETIKGLKDQIKKKDDQIDDLKIDLTERDGRIWELTQTLAKNSVPVTSFERTSLSKKHSKSKKAKGSTKPKRIVDSSSDSGTSASESISDADYESSDTGSSSSSDASVVETPPKQKKRKRSKGHHKYYKTKKVEPKMKARSNKHSKRENLNKKARR